MAHSTPPAGLRKPCPTVCTGKGKNRNLKWENITLKVYRHTISSNKENDKTDIHMQCYELRENVVVPLKTMMIVIAHSIKNVHN